MKSQASKKPKILVVDDEPDNLDLLYRTFRRDYKVLRAESGPIALEILAEEGDVAVIISDQRMPQMSGTEFLSLTAVQYPDIIRIILTGYTDVEDLVEAINSGKVFKYVTKPWESKHLQEIVRQALDTHNVLKVRTQELQRSLRRESLLNTVINTIRNAQYARPEGSPLRDVLQTIVNTVGHMLEVDVCILRPFQDEQLANEWFIYQKSSLGHQLSPETLAQTVWETQEVEILHDVEQDSRFQEQSGEFQDQAIAFRETEIESTLVVPLIFQQELMAVMALHSLEREHFWEDDEIQLVVMVADQAALAISQARAYEQVRALAKRETLINTITSAIRSSLDPRKIFAAITKQLGQALEVDGCALSLWTEDDEYVQCVGLYDGHSARVLDDLEELSHSNNGIASEEILNGNLDVQQVPQSVVPIKGNPVLQQLIDTSKPVVIEDLETSQTMQGFDLPLRSPARALLVVPLMADGQIIGSISLRQVSHPRSWQERDIELAQAVASQAAIAVQQSRLYQKTRQQAERLLELDRQKTEFFQNVSHEFRTPLTLMIGPLESAINQKEDLPYEQAAIALRNSRRLLRLVNQLLDLQRLDAGRMQANFRPCNMVEFVEQIVESFRPYCDKKGLTLKTKLTPCPSIYLDVEKFDKVLYNLLSNAMKFTGENGKITVNLDPAGDHVRLQVQDTGIGISPSQIPHLFDRFRQAEGSVSRSYEGSGLGLALVKELVEMHGGQISVDSVYQEGTTFSIWLQTGTAHLPTDMILEVPTEIESSRALVELADLESELLDSETEDEATVIVSEVDLETLSKTESSVANSLVLVVDDNPDLRTYVSSILRRAGYQVCTARNGEFGFNVALTRQPDLIITDLMMPGVSGIDLIRLIRGHEELRGTPIILLTAKADEASRIEGTEKGADAYLSKPFNDRELLAEVRNLLALKENERRVKQLNTYLTESVLKRFLPPSMVEKAARGELTLDLSPEPRLVTILFSDIVGFTRLSNQLRSRRIATVLNEYLEAMTQAVFDNGGTVDKFVGDAIVALYGSPEELQPQEQVERALASARQMYRHLDELNQRWIEQGILGHSGIPPLQFRCGIHQGPAVVGMFGGNLRSDYTAIGPSVNMAARLQEAADPNSILVSSEVVAYLNSEEIIQSCPKNLKGIDEVVMTFTVKSYRENEMKQLDVS
ncbi:MAG: response regulator [Cyanobacteriota bacterium]